MSDYAALEHAFNMKSAEDWARAEAERNALREALSEIVAIKPETIGDTGFSTGPKAHIDAAQRIARAALESKCEHEWTGCSNEVVSGGEICLKCNRIRASDEGRAQINAMEG